MFTFTFECIMLAFQCWKEKQISFLVWIIQVKIDSARVMLTNYRKKNCDKILACVSEIMSLSDWLEKILFLYVILRVSLVWQKGKQNNVLGSTCKLCIRNTLVVPCNQTCTGTNMAEYSNIIVVIIIVSVVIFNAGFFYIIYKKGRRIRVISFKFAVS